MNEINFDIIGFDLDGTLLDTSGELTASTNHALNAAGLPPLARDEVIAMIGLGAKNMLDMGLKKASPGLSDVENKARLKEYLPILMTHYEENLGSDSPPFDGVLEFMDACDSMSIKMTVVTNKYEGFATKLLKNVGLYDRFTCLLGSDSLGRGEDGRYIAKPMREPIDEMIKRSGGNIGETRAIFIGDSIYDVMAAHNAQIPAIAVSFGFLHQPVDTLGADHIIDHYDELLPLLKTL